MKKEALASFFCFPSVTKIAERKNLKNKIILVFILVFVDNGDIESGDSLTLHRENKESIMFNQSALISNTLLEGKIAANNKANEQLMTVCNQSWAKNLPTLTSMTHFVANADIQITFNGDFEAIWAAIPDKVNVYYLAGGADDCGCSPDYDGNKLEKLLARYIDRKTEDFTCANAQMEFKKESSMMMFYSIVDDIKVCWKVAVTSEEYRTKYQAKKINDVSYANGDNYVLLSI